MNRLCKVCTLYVVEEEKHLIFSCNKYISLRKQFFAKIANIWKYFTALSQESQLFWLMNNEEVILLLSNFIYD